MQDGATVALVSDAGMPLVSDPGYVLVQACLRAGVRVEVLPGPSSVLTALALSGLPGDTWRFVGFLPRKHPERVLAGPETVVAFESPHRVVATLRALDPSRPVAVCRELTKLHEEVVRGPAGEVADARQPARRVRAGRRRRHRRPRPRRRRGGRPPSRRRGGEGADGSVGRR